MFVNISISSKSLSSLNNFMYILNNFKLFKDLNLISFLKYFYKKKQIRKFTVLKSIHVNKSSQEQLEYSIFLRNVNVTSFQIFKVLVILKKVQKITGFDVVIKFKFFINFFETKKNTLTVLHPKYYNLQLQKLENFSCNRKLSIYLKIMDSFGSFNCLNSSVGRAKD